VAFFLSSLVGWGRGGRLGTTAVLAGAGFPLRRRAVWSLDPAGPWPDLGLARRRLLVLVGMKTGVGQRQQQLRMAATRRARGGGGWPTLRACGSRPRGTGLGGDGGAASSQLAAGGGAWGPLVLAALSGGARAISGLSEFFHGRSRQ
jgi:hypothetical protein